MSDGMTPRERWAQTSVHKASRYLCGKCGMRFEDPQAVYDHLDKVHPEKPSKKAKR